MSIVATDPVSLTQALVHCESVTPEEGGALTLLENVLTPLGFACHRMTFSDIDTPDVENFYARIGTGAPHLCFAGHTDVVPPGALKAWTVPPFSGEIRDGVLYGRGSVDMKGGVAAFVAAAARYLAERGQNLNGSLSFLITGDEEGPAINGTVKVLDWLKARGETLHACVVGEPSNPEALGDEIKIGRRGSLVGHLTVHGEQGHSAYPHKSDNPIPKLVHIIDRLASATLDHGTEHFSPSNLQVTVISVPNTATNVIPAEAKATFNIRYNDVWTLQSLKDWVQLQCEAAAGRTDAQFELKFASTGDVFLTKPGVLVDTMSEAVRAVTGRTPAQTTGGGTSDARFIKDYCSVIEFGLVNKTIHSVDEHVPVADLETLTLIYQKFLEEFFERD